MREPLYKLATVTAEPMLPVAGVARAAPVSLLAADTYCPDFFRGFESDVTPNHL